MEEELQKYLNLFEKLVDERTADLVTINERLQQEIAERKKTEETLTHTCRELMAKTAELETANEELFQYAYAVSHDLRTPLRAIRNYADFLREDLGSALEDEHQNHLNGLCRAVHDAENLVDGLLQLSQIGRCSVSIEIVEVGILLRKLLSPFNIPDEVECVVARDFPTIETEPVLLQQIFQNLIDNAIIFNESSHKLIEIGWRAVDEKYIEFFVRDNGIGIKPRYQEQIFQAFERLHIQEEYEGSGIGLAIVAKATRKLGGSVRVESKPGEGSTFFVTLPRTTKEKQI